MITIDRLKYFKQMAQAEHVGKAAKASSISPSVISSTISTLETELQCKLFDKDKNKLKLNANGRFLLKRTNKILDEIEKIYLEITDAPLNLKGHYRLGGSPILVNDFLVSAILKIQKQYPGISVEFNSADTAVTSANIISGTTDLAIVFKSFQHHNVDESILYEGQFRFCARNNHPIFKAKKKDRTKIINDLPAILFRPSVGVSPYENHPVFQKLNINPKNQYFYENNHTSIELISTTDGWGFLPDILIKRNAAKLKVIDIDKNFDAPVRISLIKNKTKSSFALYELLEKKLVDSFNFKGI